MVSFSFLVNFERGHSISGCFTSTYGCCPKLSNLDLLLPIAVWTFLIWCSFCCECSSYCFNSISSYLILISTLVVAWDTMSPVSPFDNEGISWIYLHSSTFFCYWPASFYRYVSLFFFCLSLELHSGFIWLSLCCSTIFAWLSSFRLEDCTRVEIRFKDPFSCLDVLFWAFLKKFGLMNLNLESASVVLSFSAILIWVLISLLFLPLYGWSDFS